MGSLIPLIWTPGDVCPGFQSQGGVPPLPCIVTCTMPSTSELISTTYQLPKVLWDTLERSHYIRQYNDITEGICTQSQKFRPSQCHALSALLLKFSDKSSQIGAPTPKVAAKSYYFATFIPRNCMKLETGGVSLVPPGSVNDYILKHSTWKFGSLSREII